MFETLMIKPKKSSFFWINWTSVEVAILGQLN